MRKGRDRGKNGKKKKKKKEKTDENSGHYVIASSWLPERRPLERRTLVPICKIEERKLQNSKIVQSFFFFLFLVGEPELNI